MQGRNGDRSAGGGAHATAGSQHIFTELSPWSFYFKTRRNLLACKTIYLLDWKPPSIDVEFRCQSTRQETSALGKTYESTGSSQLEELSASIKPYETTHAPLTQPT